MEPTTLLPVISLLLLVSVEYGGWSLLGFLTGRGQLGEFREQFFRAGHAHAGVLLVSRSSTSSTSPVPGTQQGLSGSRDCSCCWGSWPSRVASSSISASARRTEALWERS